MASNEYLVKNDDTEPFTAQNISGSCKTSASSFKILYFRIFSNESFPSKLFNGYSVDIIR
jgi:hypothetical protein